MPDRNQDFVIESREHLARIEQSLLALEKAPSQQEGRACIEQSLRSVHSLKGDAGFLGFHTLRTLAHAMESLLESLRDEPDPPSIQIVESLLAGRDRLAALVDDVEHSHESDISELLTRLSAIEPVSSQTARAIDVDLTKQAAAAGGRLGPFFQSLTQLGKINSPRLIVAETRSLSEGLPTGPLRLVARLDPVVPMEMVRRVVDVGGTPSKPGEQIYPLEIDVTAWSRSTGASLVKLLTDLAKTGHLVQPQLEFGPDDLAVSVPAGEVRLRGEFHSSTTFADLQTRLGLPTVIRGDATSDSSPTADLPSDKPPNRSSPSVRVAKSDPHLSPVASPAAIAAIETERLSSLRIHVELLDRLMTLVGELTLVRNQTLLAFAHEEGATQAIIQRLNGVTSELQDTVLRTRMQPVGVLFGRFPRMVRDLARQLGKQVEVATFGREVELDKTVLEQLSDPLTHLIRNSMDHGIESPAERVAQGKPPAGQITLSATPADGQVQIEIRDDGRGIDPAAIKAKALALRLKTESELERLSAKELYALILLPGFSTARKVTDVSGRGVGMDVVKTNLDQLEGSITIDSAPGVGTSMLLRVPLTLAIIPCLIVEVGDETYAVPQRELEEVVCLHPGGKGSIEQSYDSEVFRLRDRLLPLVRFKEVLEQPQPFTAETKAELLRKYSPASRDPNLIEYIVVLRAGGKRFGLLVDNVRGTQEVVVKPMHATVKRLGIFAGATLMGDGGVALIANVEGIVEHAGCFGAEVATASPLPAARNPTEVHRVLLFEYGAREQFALPLVQIRRIEMIDTNRIEYVGEQEFVTLNGIATRIVRLEKILDVSSCPTQPTMYLVLPKFVPEPMGILISKIIDTDSLAIELQPASLPDPILLGTAILRGRISLFLDLQRIRERIFGRLSEALKSKRPDSASTRPHVLLIDDTSFFLETIKRHLEDAGIQVTTALDGVDGLSKLEHGHFDAIICDIEMPNLDGWGFAQAARERGCRLPLLALTSLSKAEHEPRARACGFDEFQEKLDHDQLLRAIQRMLRETSRSAPAGGSL